MDKYWDNYVIEHDDFIRDSQYNIILNSWLKDKDTFDFYVVITTVLSASAKDLEICINSYEHSAKEDGIPTCTHYVHPSYVSIPDRSKEYNKAIRKKSKKSIGISLGVKHVREILWEILTYWRETGYTVETLWFIRETGSKYRKGKRVHRYRVPW